jgi:C-terminal processing protease CtpA/Prc
MGVGTSPNFPGWIAEANKPLSLNLALSNGGRDGSDHISFNGKRIPNLFFFSGLHSDYHRPTDTADKIDARGAVKVLSLVAGTAQLMANAPSRPLFTEVREERPQTASSGGGPYATYFGSVPDFRDDLKGVLFADVRPDSPAGKAGLKAGDLLVEFAGEPIKNLYDFTDALGSKKPGDVVAVVVQRNGQSIKVNVTLEVRR